MILQLLTSIILVFMRSSTYHHLLTMTCRLCCPPWLWEPQVRMDVSWMAWIRCAMDTLGEQQTQLISIIILDSHLGIRFVMVVSSAQMTPMTTTIAMKGSQL